MGLPTSDPNSISNRIMPWGNETGGQAQRRIYKAGLEAALRDVVNQKCRDGIDIDTAMYEAMSAYPPEATAEKEIGASFMDTCRKGFERNINATAGIEEELSWIAANMHRDKPRVHAAPSHAAIAQLIDLREDKTLRQKLWSVYWSKRLNPGNRRPRTDKNRAFSSEDGIDQETSDQEELMRRLRGDLD